MKKEISITGSISVALYLALVLYLHLEAKHCAEADGLWCGFGYLVAGFPWNWIFLSLADVFTPGNQASVDQKLLWGIFFASVVINSFVFYLVGRFIANAVVRLRAKMKFGGAT